MQFLIFTSCLGISASLGQITHEYMCKIFNKGLTYMSSDFNCGICRPAVCSFWKTLEQFRSNRYIYLAGFSVA